MENIEIIAQEKAIEKTEITNKPVKKRKNIKKSSIEAMNALLKEWKRRKNKVIYNREPRPDEYIGYTRAYVYTKVSMAFLTYKRFDTKKVVTLSAHLDKEFDGVTKTGSDAYNICQHYYKLPETNTKETAPFSVGIAPYRNTKFVGKRVQAYGYDMNSAFSYGMTSKLPDTTKPLGAGFVMPGEYGFDINGNKIKVGKYAKYRFPLIDSPYKRFIDKYYDKKKNAHNIYERNEAKFILNSCIGAMQNHNAYMRAAIINNFFTEILELRRKYADYIISSTTDSIVSTIKIPELDKKLSNKIGDWKLEHQGTYAIHTNGYSTQWNYEQPAFGAGKPKSWFKEGWDILKDPTPECGNIYEYSHKKLQFIKAK